MSKTLKVGLVQQAAWPDKQRSLDESEAGIRELAERGAELVLLQELHATHYFCQCEDAELFDLAEPLDGPTATRLAELARELDIVLVGSIFERRAAGVYHNTAVVMDRGRGRVGHYRKMHIPDDPGFYEKFYFTPGDTDAEQGFEPIDTSVGRLGVLVCWDQWYPEAARLMALAGAELLLYPTAIGWHPPDDLPEKSRQKDAWTLVQRAHGVANGLPVLVANRVGHEPDHSGVTEGVHFWGGSFICGPQGELLAHAGDDSERLPGRARYEPQRTHKTHVAVSSRPAHRRLWRPDQALSRSQIRHVTALATPRSAHRCLRRPDPALSRPLRPSPARRDC